jgi:hypothetical protein
VVLTAARRVRDSWENYHATSYVFTFAEKWEKNQSRDNQDLQHDGNQKCATLVAANTFFLIGVAFDQTAIQKAHTFFGNRGNRHHTPPETFPARRGRFAAPVP